MNGRIVLKEIKLTEHAEKNIIEREISVDILYVAINNPDSKLNQGYNRVIYMKLYFDELLSEQMLLRVVVEEDSNEILVITVYKTSKINKYLKGYNDEN